MKLYFLRHGAAEERTDSRRDYDRRLTSEGIEEMKYVAVGLSRLVGEVDLLLSSPLPRALETARIVEQVVKVASGGLRISESLAAGTLGSRQLEDLLHGVPQSHRVMFVGHEPDLSGVVQVLTGASIEMKKAGLAFIEAYRIEPNGGVLRWLLTPRLIRCAAGDLDSSALTDALTSGNG